MDKQSLHERAEIDDKRIQFEFASMEEFNATIAELRPGDNDNRCSVSNDRQDDWAGTSLEEAERLAVEGWPEGLEYISEIEADIGASSLGSIPSRSYAPCGYRPSVPRYLAGNPRHMVGRGEDIRGGAPIIRMGVNCGASAAISPEAMRKRGFAIMATIDYLESLDFRVEVNVGWCARLSKDWTYTVPIKRAEEPLDRDGLVFAVAHPSFLRRLGFKLLEQFNVVTPGYGVPSSLPNADEFDLYFDKMLFNSQADVRDIIRDSLSALPGAALEELLEGLDVIYQR